MRPEITTAILVPTDEVAKVPTAEPVFNVTASPATTPTKAAEPTFNVAVVDASYVLPFAVIPETVNAFAVTICDKTPEVLPLKLLSPP